MNAKPLPGPYHCDGKLIVDPIGRIVGSVSGSASIPMVAATAALFAASPELFDALADVLKMAEKWADGKHSWHPDHERCEAARAALAKAKGTSK